MAPKKLDLKWHFASGALFWVQLTSIRIIGWLIDWFFTSNRAAILQFHVLCSKHLGLASLIGWCWTLSPFFIFGTFSMSSVSSGRTRSNSYFFITVRTVAADLWKIEKTKRCFLFHHRYNRSLDLSRHLSLKMKAMLKRPPLCREPRWVHT